MWQSSCQKIVSGQGHFSGCRIWTCRLSWQWEFIGWYHYAVYLKENQRPGQSIKVLLKEVIQLPVSVVCRDYTNVLMAFRACWMESGPALVCMGPRCTRSVCTGQITVNVHISGEPVCWHLTWIKHSLWPSHEGKCHIMSHQGCYPPLFFPCAFSSGQPLWHFIWQVCFHICPG